MPTKEYTIREDRQGINEAIQTGNIRARSNYARAIELADKVDWMWGENAGIEDYTGTDSLMHQLTGELPLGRDGYRDEEYHRCNDAIGKELYADFNMQTYRSVFRYIENATKSEASRDDRLIALDFAKQYALTIFHAVQYPMRTSDVAPSEMETIDQAAEAARLLTRSFYLGILGHDDPILNRGLEEACTILQQQNVKDAILTAKPAHFKVQELDQPLTILASSLLATDDYPKTDLIYGLPAGGTQHAIVTQLLFELKNKGVKPPQLEYLPISTHSAGKKALDGTVSPSIDTVMQRSNSNSRNVLICEDNSNTGTTLAIATDVVRASSPASMHVSLVEFDPLRLRVKHRHPDPLTNIANYQHPDFTTAVGIVPITVGKYPDIQIRKMVSLRRKLPRQNEAELQYDRTLQYDNLPDDFYSAFYETYKMAIRYCGDTYGYRNPYLVSAVMLRHFIERGDLPDTSHDDQFKDLFKIANAGTTYPYMPHEQAKVLEDGSESLDYTIGGPWMRSGANELISELIDYSAENDTNVHLWTKGDASFYSHPPHMGMEEQLMRYEKSGLKKSLAGIGFESSGRGKFIAHPKKTRLLQTRLLPDLMRHNSSIRDVVVVDDSEKNLAEAAQAIRLFGLQPHIINPLSADSGRSNLHEIATFARNRQWGPHATFIIDMDDTLLHELFRKYHQPRNMALAMAEQYPQILMSN